MDLKLRIKVIHVNPCRAPYSWTMNTTDTLITREQAAALAGVTPRTINRWSAARKLTVKRQGWRQPALYRTEEVLAVARDNAPPGAA